jgi:hypothetical protein
MRIDAPVVIGDLVVTSGAVKAVSFNVGGFTGASGTFTTTDSKTIIVDFGIIRSIATNTAARLFSWTIQNPAVGGIPGPRLKQDMTCVRLDSMVSFGEGVFFNIEERPYAYTGGVDIVSSDQIAVTTGATTPTFSNASLAADNWLWVDISAATGTTSTTYLQITLSVTV